MNKEVLEKIKDIISDICEIDASHICFESSIMEDLDLASIELFSVLSEIQRAYSIKISSNELTDIETVGALVELIENKMK